MGRPTHQVRRSQWWLGALLAPGLLGGQALCWLLPADGRPAAYGAVLVLAYTAALSCLFALRTSRWAMPVGLAFLWVMPVSAVLMVVAFAHRP